MEPAQTNGPGPETGRLRTHTGTAASHHGQRRWTPRMERWLGPRQLGHTHRGQNHVGCQEKQRH